MINLRGLVGMGRFGVTRKNRYLENFQKALFGDRWIFEGLWKWYHNEGLGEVADGGRTGKRTLLTLRGQSRTDSFSNAA